MRSRFGILLLPVLMLLVQGCDQSSTWMRGLSPGSAPSAGDEGTLATSPVPGAGLSSATPIVPSPNLEYGDEGFAVRRINVTVLDHDGRPMPGVAVFVGDSRNSVNGHHRPVVNGVTEADGTVVLMLSGEREYWRSHPSSRITGTVTNSIVPLVVANYDVLAVPDPTFVTMAPTSTIASVTYVMDPMAIAETKGITDPEIAHVEAVIMEGSHNDVTLRLDAPRP